MMLGQNTVLKSYVCDQLIKIFPVEIFVNNIAGNKIMIEIELQLSITLCMFINNVGWKGPGNLYSNDSQSIINIDPQGST